MRIRIAVLLAVTVLAGCTANTDATSNPASSATTTSPTASTTTTTAPPTRINFSPELYIGMNSQDAVVLLKNAGWDVLLWDKAGSTGWDMSIKVVNVVKDEATGLARIEVTPEAPEPAAPAGISDGTYLVGTDMEPGSYKSPGSKGCYWARMKDDSGQKIIANDIGDGPTRFTAKKGEYVKISRCTFTKV